MCGVIFVLLVAVKLLFPQTVSRLAQTAGELIGRDADFAEAFAAMGRAVSGEETVGDSLQDAYTAVFNPADESDAVLANAGAEIEENHLDPAAKLMRFTEVELPEQKETVASDLEVSLPESTAAEPQQASETEKQPQETAQTEALVEIAAEET